MLTALPGRDQTAGAWLRETFAAVGRVPVEKPPVVWAFTPYFTGNPFQAVLYDGFFSQGMVAAPVFQAAQLEEVTRGWPADLPLVVHLHWLNQVLRQVSTPAEASAAVARHTELLDLLRSRGARLVWTVHNVLPHDAVFVEAEIELRRAVAERAELVHVMSPDTQRMLAPAVELASEKLYRCDHPGYQGVYPDWISRDDARRRLQIPERSVALLLTGALKPYKGMTELLGAVQRVNADRPGAVTLIVAGRPDQAPETSEFVVRAVQEPAVRLLPGKIVDADMQVLFRAADVVALPYRRSLNSGVLALGLSFGRPALLPSASGSVPVAQDAAVVYDAADPDGLVGAIRTVVDGARDGGLAALGRAAIAAGQRIDRASVTARFAADLRAWADAPVLQGVS